MDIRVMNPPTKYRDGRPEWLILGGRRSAEVVQTPECAEEACVVEAFNAAWEERAVPYDRVEVKSARASMYLPPGVELDVRGYRLDGSPIFRRRLMGPPRG